MWGVILVPECGFLGPESWRKAPACGHLTFGLKIGTHALVGVDTDRRELVPLSSSAYMRKLEDRTTAHIASFVSVLLALKNMKNAYLTGLSTLSIFYPERLRGN